VCFAGHIISDVDKVVDDLKAHFELPGPHLIFFTADPDPGTGIAWCPDCARSEDVIREEVLGSGGSLLEVQVRKTIKIATMIDTRFQSGD
jgi:hypothetical protein